MDAHSIETAYQPFVAALREGGFPSPSDGWPAELIAAHVALNNDLIAETAEQIAAGAQPTYNNTEVIDDAELSAYADSVGGLEGLADAVTTSARRLAQAWSGLDEVAGNYLLPATIFDAGTLVREGPIPIRSFIDLNASFHLELHFKQLMALRL